MNLWYLPRGNEIADEGIGISYGTVLGATLAAMFPEKVDKMIIDGVVNAHEYYQNK